MQFLYLTIHNAYNVLRYSTTYVKLINCVWLVCCKKKVEMIDMIEVLFISAYNVGILRYHKSNNNMWQGIVIISILSVLLMGDLDI